MEKRQRNRPPWSSNSNEKSNLGSITASHKGIKVDIRALKFMYFYSALHYPTTKEAMIDIKITYCTAIHTVLYFFFNIQKSVMMFLWPATQHRVLSVSFPSKIITLLQLIASVILPVFLAVNPHIISCYMNINWRGKNWIRFTDITVCTTHYWSIRHQSAQGKKDQKKKKNAGCVLCCALSASGPPSSPNLCIAIYVDTHHANIDSLPCITWLMTGNVKTLLSELLWNMWNNTLFLAPGCSTLTLLIF